MKFIWQHYREDSLKRVEEKRKQKENVDLDDLEQEVKNEMMIMFERITLEEKRQVIK